MKKWIAILSALLILLLGACLALEIRSRRQADVQLQVPDTAVQTVATAPPTQAPAEEATEPPTLPPAEPPTETTAPQVLFFTEEEEMLLLKIGMAERGNTGCVDCIALVMRTVLNRVEGPKFSSTIKGVIYAQDQFTPVAEGTFEHVVPNEACYEALDRIERGWDESQGALYYEWCEGESWHSRNLHLLLQHCDTRFYN